MSRFFNTDFDSIFAFLLRENQEFGGAVSLTLLTFALMEIFKPKACNTFITVSKLCFESGFNARLFTGLNMQSF
jgi:hypothetical protein